MSVGPFELLLLIVVIFCAISSGPTGWQQWLGYVLCCVIAVLVTPPDVVSTLWVALPLCIVYTVVGAGSLLCIVSRRKPPQKSDSSEV